MSKLELLSFPFTHSLVLRINEGGKVSWSPKAPGKALRTRPRPGDGSGHRSGVSALVHLCQPLYGKSTVQEKSLCTASCLSLLGITLPLTPSSPPQLPHPQAEAETPPKPIARFWPRGGSRDPPLVSLSSHWSLPGLSAPPSLTTTVLWALLCNP